MKDSHFTVIIPAYNCKNWVVKNLNSVINQDYENYKIVYVDDCSKDDTYQIAESILSQSGKDYEIVRNESNMKALYNLHTHITRAEKGTIIVTLDGDDSLAGVDVFNTLNKHYQDANCWMTVGSYVQNDNYIVVSPQVSDDYWDHNIRKMPWSFSHLRTFRKELFCKIEKKDLLDLDDRFYSCTFDRAMMYPMVEMSGKERVRLINDVLYIYNRNNPISVDKVHRYDQLRIESQICKKRPYKKLKSL
jgi:glycosyltransferase involved in cell wall biosynthesis